MWRVLCVVTLTAALAPARRRQVLRPGSLDALPSRSLAPVLGGRGVHVRGSYLDEIGPSPDAEETAPAAAPPSAEEAPAVDAAPLTLSDSMLGEFSSRSTRNEEAARRASDHSRGVAAS